MKKNIIELIDKKNSNRKLTLNDLETLKKHLMEEVVDLNQSIAILKFTKEKTL